MTSHEADHLYYKRVLKRIMKKPHTVQIVMERTYHSALAVLDELDGIPFEDLAREIFFLSKDSLYPDIACFYDSQLELAGANPERFIFELHAFYKDFIKTIKSDQKYRDLVDFIGNTMRFPHTKTATVAEPIVNAYMDLIMQTSEYLRPDFFDLGSGVYGLGTDGTLLSGPIPFPFSDIPSCRIRHGSVNGRKFKSKSEALSALQSYYREYGLEMESAADMEVFEKIQRIHSNAVQALLPYINEYTYDIVSQNEYDATSPPLLLFREANAPLDMEVLADGLSKNRCMLPSNGVDFVFYDPIGELRSLLLKETAHSGQCILLYRLETCNGPISGYFDAQSKYFWSLLQDATNLNPYFNLASLVLVLYTTVGLYGESVDLDSYFLQDGRPLLIRAMPRYGPLRNMYLQANALSNTYLREICSSGIRISKIEGVFRELTWTA